MVEKKKNKKKAQLPFRTNIIFFVVFLLFSTLILQLGVVQILNGEAYQDEIDLTIQDRTKIPVPRGVIYDRNENLVVDNIALYSITYTPPKGVQAQDRLDTAEKLAVFISMDSEDELEKITDFDKREYLYLKDLVKNEGVAEEDKEPTFADRLTEEEKKLSNSEVYRKTLDKITEAELSDGNFTKQELEVIRIKKELDKAYSLTPQIVKNEGVTPEEYALVSENLADLPGVNATTDWDRVYNYDSTLRTLLGNITNHSAGIPAEDANYYLTRGYNRNDRVGISGLEQQYEDYLRGRKEQIEYITTKSGTVIDSEVLVEGEKGKDLILTIDMEFQEIVDNILREELERTISIDRYNNREMKDALAVVMNPKTGELLAVSGQTYDHEDRSFFSNPQKALLDTHVPGSIIKGATVLAGYESGVIVPGQSFRDSPIQIKSSPIMRSFSSSIGVANDIKALKESSNVYMYYIALRMGGEYRNPFPNGEPASFNPAAWQEMRNYFQQFGLGVSTGVDYPTESTGYIGESVFSPGNLMHFSIGQYDRYTALQLAQYISTIANDGYRVRPHFVKEIREPIASMDEIGPVYKTQNTEYLNRIQMSDSNIARVQEGFRQAFQVQRGTAYRYFGDKDYNPAGKTGTAEHALYLRNETTGKTTKFDTINRSMVGYAPADDPEIAFAVVVPSLGANATEDGNVANRISERILDAYFERNNDENNEEEEAETDE